MKDRTSSIVGDDPPFDQQLDDFSEWLWDFRNQAGQPEVYSYLTFEEMRQIWLRGLLEWHGKQRNFVGPPEDYRFHSAKWKEVCEEIQEMPDFRPTWTMK